LKKFFGKFCFVLAAWVASKRGLVEPENLAGLVKSRKII
jgi:hypothetical protein